MATSQGLVVPVVRGVQRRSVLDVARELARLRAAGQAGSLSQTDLTSRTFTLSNIGSVSNASASGKTKWAKGTLELFFHRHVRNMQCCHGGLNHQDIVCSCLAISWLKYTCRLSNMFELGFRPVVLALLVRFRTVILSCPSQYESYFISIC